jgi:Methyltransferase domain
VTSTLTLLLVNLAWLAVCAVLVRRLWVEREARRRRNIKGNWPVRTIPAAAFDDVFRAGRFGHGPETEVAFIAHGPEGLVAATSDFEAWILAVLSKRARLLFEFGTGTGKTAYLWARNSPPDAQVVTVTLAPDERASYRPEAGDDLRDSEGAVAESVFSDFVYSRTDVAPKVRQIFADSKTLDVAEWAGRCDLVFVDGSHAYSYVAADSAKALELVRPGGIVLWHDYAGPKHSPGVYRALNELARRLPLARIEHTTLVGYRRPSESTTI